MGMDLWIAIGFVAAISGLAFIAGQRLSLSVYRHRPLLFVECLLFSLVFAFGLFGRLTWANAFPSSAAVCWSNWMPVFLAFTAGLAFEITALRPRWRKGVAGILVLLGIGFLTLPVIRPTLSPISIAHSAVWKDGVCLQSNESSCGPAAAATLLRQRGILHATRLVSTPETWVDTDLASCERKLAELCLTSDHGTAPLGLFRGLQLAVAGSGVDARIADSNPRFWEKKCQLPNVAVVRFQSDQPRGNVRQLLGSDGDGHAVVVHSRTEDGNWLVADPAVGWRQWDDREFANVFTGDAIYLAPREFPDGSVGSRSAELERSIQSQITPIRRTHFESSH